MKDGDAVFRWQFFMVISLSLYVIKHESKVQRFMVVDDKKGCTVEQLESELKVFNIRKRPILVERMTDI